MNKKIIIAISSICAVIIIAAVVYACARYGWRLKGFDGASDSSEILVTEVTQYSGKVIVKGTTLSSAKKYDGYIYEFKDGNLYIGLRYSPFFGKNGDFEITLEKGENEINYILLKSHNQESFVWPFSKADEYYQTNQDGMPEYRTTDSGVEEDEDMANLITTDIDIAE